VVALTDGEYYLIRRAQADDPDAFCLLAERYTRRVYSLAFHYCHNAQDAEDLSQEVWLKAYQALGTFRAESSFYTWLRRITINCFLNHQRSTSFRSRGQSTTVQLMAVDTEIAAIATDSQSGSAETLYNKVLFDSVILALAELTPSQRLVFLLRHHEGMSYEEISEVVGCSTGTAKKAVSRAIAKLRVKLDGRSETVDGIPCSAT
jgi:RNA polymerase sigma-70 factor, ECF subfamily